MILKKIKVECIDSRTGFVLKKIKTSEWEHLNRKLAVNNSILNSELSRLRFKKPIFDTPFQIQHLRYIKKFEEWDFGGINKSKKHASKNNRFFLAFQQRSSDNWEVLTWHEAENDFQDLAGRGLSLVPYSIPQKGALDDWKTRKKDAESILNKSQSLVPILCSNHQRELFEPIMNKEFEESKLMGVQCYNINDYLTLLNLNKIKIKNMSIEEGEETPFILGLSYGKKIKSISNVSGAFAYSCFGFDILSDRQIFLENMPSDVVQKILDKKPDELYRYDTTEGGFNFSDEQIFWKNVNMTKAFLNNVTLSEGLAPYQAIQWANHHNQQNDFKTLNDNILLTKEEPNSTIDFIREKSRWSSYWNEIIAKA